MQDSGAGSGKQIEHDRLGYRDFFPANNILIQNFPGLFFIQEKIGIRKLLKKIPEKFPDHHPHLPGPE
jgi:hypothetical protein